MNMNTKTKAPSTSEDFNKAYNAPFTFWGDTRIPKELKGLIKTYRPASSLELGCGLGRFSEFMANQGIQATAVDFSSIAIKKAQKRVEENKLKPRYIVGDVTNLEMLCKPYDVAFDIGCFHCLHEEDQQKYISEIHRLLKPESMLLIWAIDQSPSGINLTPEYMEKIFAGKFQLMLAKFSRRRIIASHWYWLEARK